MESELFTVKEVAKELDVSSNYVYGQLKKLGNDGKLKFGNTVVLTPKGVEELRSIKDHGYRRTGGVAPGTKRNPSTGVRGVGGGLGIYIGKDDSAAAIVGLFDRMDRIAKALEALVRAWRTPLRTEGALDSPGEPVKLDKPKTIAIDTLDFLYGH